MEVLALSLSFALSPGNGIVVVDYKSPATMSPTSSSALSLSAELLSEFFSPFLPTFLLILPSQVPSSGITWNGAVDTLVLGG